jgi:4-aminobutyrate aminotransferase-like enzyme
VQVVPRAAGVWPALDRPEAHPTFICESALSCAGQVILRPGFLREAYAAVRGAGGVCIADEVQTGFGRPGSHFWMFETQEVVPDIVTLGKPIGNGHPMGAVITTPEIAASFANGMEYFNTFGGNPVSCAVGLAVLDVIRDEGLQENARDVGEYLVRGLRGLAERHPSICDVRGLGLFLGFELIDAQVADELVNRMKERGVLLSTDGPRHNVIKIKPPLIFSRGDADLLLERLDTELP